MSSTFDLDELFCPGPGRGNTDEDHPSGLVMCKRCRTKHLHWEDDGDGGWLLLNSHNEVHHCPPARPADFEDVSQ